jgi:enterochelin esterase-like enzyme
MSQIEGVERARAVLEEHGAEVNRHRYRGGHTFEHWRAELSDALPWLLRTE